MSFGGNDDAKDIGDSDFLAGMGEFVNAQLIESLWFLFGGNDDAKDILESATVHDLDTVILTREEARVVVGQRRPKRDREMITEMVEVPDLTVRDVFETYFAMTEEERFALHERLYGAGKYSTATKPENIHNDTLALQAIDRAIVSEGNQGRNPLDIQPPDDWKMPEPAEPLYARSTEAQISGYADNAATAVFGRAASDDERKFAVNLFRKLEESPEFRPGGADLESSFRERGQREASQQAMGGTLRSFMNIVAAR